jgi:hypothetical protein
MEKLTIDRGEWLTGTAAKILDDNRLRESKTGLMCCLGVYGQACGVPTYRLNSNVMPVHGIRIDFPEMQWLTTTVDAADVRKFKLKYIGPGSWVQEALANINDSARHPTRKESAIAYFFKKYGGIEVTFTGRYAVATSKAKKVNML